MVGGALCAAGLALFSCSDRFELDEKQPSGLENIYGYMKDRGNYTNYLHLIDDLGQTEILSRTGSKTMFIADDDAFADFYASNPWGVRSYEELSQAQKKLLLNSSMVDNPYTSTMLSSAEATPGSGRPTKGEVCRRNTSQSIYDSVMIVQGEDPNDILPHNDRFDELRANYAGKDIVLFTDAEATPMLHFTGQFVTSNRLELTDIDFIYNQGDGSFKSDDIYVNDSRVTEANIFCKNGFVHKVDKVIMPLDNMAEIIRKEPQMSLFSLFLERFAYPKDSVRLKETYNLTYGTDYDTVFVKHYFADRTFLDHTGGSTGNTGKGHAINTDKNGNRFQKTLKYDPGWNSYLPEIANDRQPMMEDAAVMLVPSNEALREWWTNGVGKTLADYYYTPEGTMEAALEAYGDTLVATLGDLIRVNQLPSLAGALPSTFSTVLNDANQQLGIQRSHVDRVYRGSNGLVYLTNRVFSPAKYVSVLYPTSVDKARFSTMEKIINDMEYEYYLNSMVSRFIFLLPTNEGLLTYVDPVSYAVPQKRVWQFYLNEKRELIADVYEATQDADGNYIPRPGASRNQLTGGVGNSHVKNRLTDLLDNNIIVEPYRPGKKYYITKGRTFVKVENTGDKLYDVRGSFQLDINQPVPLSEDAYPEENGIAIPMNGIAMTTPKSVAATLHDAVVPGLDSQNDSIFKKFYEIVNACAVAKANSKTGYEWQAADQTYGNLFNQKTAGLIGNEAGTGDKATLLLNNYHYTIYAPTNDAMDEAFAAGLPTIDQLREADAWDIAMHYKGTGTTAADHVHSRGDSLREVMLDFVKYHIQDNAIFVDVDTTGTFESGKTPLMKATTIDSDTGEELPWNGTYTPSRPYTLTVNVSGGNMTVTDCRKGYHPTTHAFQGGNTARVYTTEGAFNLMAREYWIKSAAAPTNTNTSTLDIDNSSAVVIHAINHPLLYADGTSYDSHGDLVPTQFIYNYQPLSK